MEKYSFFNAVLTEQGTYDRVYKAEDIADYFSSFIGNGVYPNPSTNLQIASSNDGMKIYAKPGKAWINGYYYENTEDLTFRIDNADAQYDRIDDIVLRLDFLQRTITIQIKKGNPAISPAEQALQRDSDIHELRLAKVYVTKGAINITDVDITDTRQNSEDCGIVSGVVQQINTDDLFLQYNTAFDTWFEHVKDKLSEDAAGNLQAQIDNLNIKMQLPIGYIFDWAPVEGQDIDLSTSYKVNQYFGYGTWREISGRFTFGCDEEHTAGSTGGDAAHAHLYAVRYAAFYGSVAGSNTEAINVYDYETNEFAKAEFDAQIYTDKNTGLTTSANTTSISIQKSTGYTSTESSMPPYLAVYKWQRIA